MKVKLLLILVHILLISAIAYPADKTAETSKKSQDRTEIFGNYNFGIGIERINTTATYLNSFSARFPIIQKLRAGTFFGFADTFEDIATGPQILYNFYSISNVSFFGEVSVYYRRGLTRGNGISGNTLAGIEIMIPKIEALRFSLAYGIVWDAVRQNDMSINNDLFGNLGIHYYF
jgi:hypothetical protein